MKKVLGLDLGTTSIGWALVNEAETANEQSSIIKLGVRISQLDNFEKVDKTGKVSESKNPTEDFASGKGLSPNAGRTQRRGARRNLQRYKLRRKNLIAVLTNHGIINSQSVLTEDGEHTTFETLGLRAKAAKEKIQKDQLARVLISINKKRGYKSSRKAQNEDEGQAIDGMAVAIKLYEERITPGCYCYQLLQQGRKIMPDFYRSDLINEFERVWDFQKQYYPEILDDELHKAIQGQGMQSTRKRLLAIKGIFTAENKGKKEEKKLNAYLWRSKAISERLEIDQLAFVLAEINNNLNSSSGYLGAISDRSKNLYLNKQTVGEYLYEQITKNRHTRLKGKAFYRQDYFDEFEQIWETQKLFHTELTDQLKNELRDIIIFYQRRLKSQKWLISHCEFESKPWIEIVDGKKKIKVTGSRVCPKSSPIFQEFKIWQNLSNLEFTNKKTKQVEKFVDNDLETKQLLFNELNIKGNLKKNDVLRLFELNPNEWNMNYLQLQGNTTNKILYEAFQKIIFHEGHEIDFSKSTADEIKESIRAIFGMLGISTEILFFNAEEDGAEFEKQKSFQLWHLLYSYEGDNSKSGNEAIYNVLNKKFGFKKEHAQYLINLNFQDDYGSLSTKAIRKIFPFIKECTYSKACEFAGYNHSHSVTKEENEKRILKDRIELIPKNSLRNPVVEKILNQMVNVVNAIIDDPTLGKPDEIRIELARELKKSAKEREKMTESINNSKKLHDEYHKILMEDFHILNPTRNDIIRYKLYLELKSNGFKTLYSNQYIPQEKLFSKEIDIEHIIPKTRLFDDSFSNKTLEFRNINIDKSNETAVDFIKDSFGLDQLNLYKTRIEKLYNEGAISKAKYKKLLMEGSDIGEGFIERDLRESQYIAKKAKNMLYEICRNVISTTGSITDTLREDWGLINTLQELNIDKYRSLGLTKFEERKEGQVVEKIIDWTKRNDHRHHAMDALTVAFTKHSHIQYLNNLNARRDIEHKKHAIIIAIENKEVMRDENNKRKFKPPIPNFRSVAKKELEKILISHKSKNKVVTQNKYKIQGHSKAKVSLTPRGQLHKETIYGKSKYYESNMVKVGTGFDLKMINQVANPSFREAILRRFIENDNDAVKAFGGKNSPAKNPIFTSDNVQLPEKVKVVWMADRYTIQKDVTPDLKLDKVVDKGIQRILQRRLEEYGNNPKEAFVNLDENPIWLNKEKGIAIKRVTISGVSNVEALHTKKDHFGNEILDENGKPLPVDFVSTGNNHHVAIYKDEIGKLQEDVVSFYEAVARVNEGLPIIKKQHEKGWEFQFTMKQNEIFVFPADNFDPSEIDLLNPENNSLISPHLFRVQKFTIKDYFFRHHLETTVENNNALKDITWKREGLSGIEGIVKVRLNHLGQIVCVGEC
jgi:CRISPR-associated endonuclease Csn1